MVSLETKCILLCPNVLREVFYFSQLLLICDSHLYCLRINSFCHASLLIFSVVLALRVGYMAFWMIKLNFDFGRLKTFSKHNHVWIQPNFCYNIVFQVELILRKF